MTENPMSEAIGKVSDGALDLDSGRFALAFLIETARPEDHSADTIQCVMNTLAEAAQNLKAGLDILEEFKAKRLPAGPREVS